MPARLGLGLASLALAALLLLGFRPPQDARLVGATGTGSGGGGGSGVGSSSGAGGGSGTTGAQKTYDGTVVSTRYGPVQVEIAVSGGRIVSVTALELPSGGRSSAISSYVEPVLSGEALAAQTASIDLVSGATYTSEAYAQSLQAALDRAGL